jgi:probable HAF family extracellular repeat protein
MSPRLVAHGLGRRSLKAAIAAAAILGATVAAGVPGAQAAQLRPVDLGTLGGSYSTATDINELGVIVGGSATADGAFHAVMWDKNGIHDLGGVDASATAINNKGQIVMTSYTAAGNNQEALLWDHGAVTKISNSPRDTDAVDINDRGQAVGAHLTATDPGYVAFVWYEGVLTELPPLPQHEESWAVAINRAGDVLGMSAHRGAGRYQPVVWSNGGTTPIGPESGPIGYMDLNDQGDVVITRDNGQGGSIVELWSHGNVTTIGNPGDTIYVTALTNDDDLVGARFDPNDFTQHAARWLHGPRFEDLGTLGGPNSAALETNALGQVVGYSDTAAFETHAVVWR